MQDQFISIDGVRIRYRDSGGDSVPVLMTHGIGGSLELWNKQFESLGKEKRLIAWDLPGHGLSELGNQPYDPDRYSAFGWRFIDALGLDTLYLVGNSLGGAISLRIADLQPGRISGLLLADAATLGRETPLPFRLMTLPLLGELMNKPGPMAVEQQLKSIFHDPRIVTDEISNIVTRNIHKPDGAKAFLGTLRLMTNLRGQNMSTVGRSLAIVQALKQPIVFVHGRHDAVLPLSHSEAASKLARSGQFFVLENCGHTPQIEAPEQFNQILQELIAKATVSEVA